MFTPLCRIAAAVLEPRDTIENATQLIVRQRRPNVGLIPRMQQAGDEVRIHPSPQQMTGDLRRGGVGIAADGSAGESLPDLRRSRVTAFIGRALYQPRDQ